MDIIERLAAASIAVGMAKKNADACVIAADEISQLRAMLADPDNANLRCLESSVKNLIACLCRHDGSALRGSIPTTGTISGDLYAAIAATVRNEWDNNTLSDLQRRYPLPKPIDAAQAGSDGGRELPAVPCEVSDGGGSAERGGVCGSADVGAPLSYADAPPSYCGVDMGEPGGDRAEVWYEMPVKAFEEALEQARSTTRRNILQAISGLNGGFPPPGLPQQDVAVAVAVLRQAVKDENEAERNVQELERQLLDAASKLSAYEFYEQQRELELRQALKSRDGQIKSLNAQVDRLARHIAFQAAK
jgi:hypothetical protein